MQTVVYLHLFAFNPIVIIYHLIYTKNVQSFVFRLTYLVFGLFILGLSLILIIAGYSRLGTNTPYYIVTNSLSYELFQMDWTWKSVDLIILGVMGTLIGICIIFASLTKHVSLLILLGELPIGTRNNSVKNRPGYWIRKFYLITLLLTLGLLIFALINRSRF